MREIKFGCKLKESLMIWWAFYQNLEWFDRDTVMLIIGYQYMAINMKAASSIITQT